MKKRTYTNEDKKRSVFRLRDILFVAALVSNIRWIMAIALVAYTISIILQLRSDWKTYRGFNWATILYVCIALAIIVFFTYSLVAPRT